MVRAHIWLVLLAACSSPPAPPATHDAGAAAHRDAAPAPAPPLDAAEVPSGDLHAIHASGVLAIDDPRWEQATPLSFASDWAGRPAAARTTVRAAWSAEALVVRWDVEDTGLRTDRARPVEVEREKLYEEDCVELFVAPDPAHPTRYAEIEVGPFGHYFDLWIDRDTPSSDAAWSARLIIATHQDLEAHLATIQIAIAAPEITAVLRPAAVLRVGLYRMEGRRPRLYLAAFPTGTPKPKFHVPSAFGTLVLDP